MFFDLPAAPPQLPAKSPSPERHSKGAADGATTTTTPGKLRAAGRKMLCHDGRGGAVLRDWAAPPDPAQQAAGAAVRTATDAELRSLFYTASGRQPLQPPAQRERPDVLAARRTEASARAGRRNMAATVAADEPPRSALAASDGGGQQPSLWDEARQNRRRRQQPTGGFDGGAGSGRSSTSMRLSSPPRRARRRRWEDGEQQQQQQQQEEEEQEAEVDALEPDLLLAAVARRHREQAAAAAAADVGAAAEGGGQRSPQTGRSDGSSGGDAFYREEEEGEGGDDMLALGGIDYGQLARAARTLERGEREASDAAAAARADALLAEAAARQAEADGHAGSDAVMAAAAVRRRARVSLLAERKGPAVASLERANDESTLAQALLLRGAAAAVGGAAVDVGDSLLVARGFVPLEFMFRRAVATYVRLHQLDALGRWRDFLREKARVLAALREMEPWVLPIQRGFRLHRAIRQARVARAMALFARAAAAALLQSRIRGAAARWRARAEAARRWRLRCAAGARLLQRAYRGKKGREQARRARRALLQSALLELTNGDLSRLDRMDLDPPVRGAFKDVLGDGGRGGGGGGGGGGGSGGDSVGGGSGGSGGDSDVDDQESGLRWRGEEPAPPSFEEEAEGEVHSELRRAAACAPTWLEREAASWRADHWADPRKAMAAEAARVEAHERAAAQRQQEEEKAAEEAKYAEQHHLFSGLKKGEKVRAVHAHGHKKHGHKKHGHKKHGHKKHGHHNHHHHHHHHHQYHGPDRGRLTVDVALAMLELADLGTDARRELVTLDTADDAAAAAEAAALGAGASAADAAVARAEAAAAARAALARRRAHLMGAMALVHGATQADLRCCAAAVRRVAARLARHRQAGAAAWRAEWQRKRQRHLRADGAEASERWAAARSTGREAAELAAMRAAEAEQVEASRRRLERGEEVVWRQARARARAEAGEREQMEIEDMHTMELERVEREAARKLAAARAVIAEQAALRAIEAARAQARMAAFAAGAAADEARAAHSRALEKRRLERLANLAGIADHKSVVRRREAAELKSLHERERDFKAKMRGKLRDEKEARWEKRKNDAHLKAVERARVAAEKQEQERIEGERAAAKLKAGRRARCERAAAEEELRVAWLREEAEARARAAHYMGQADAEMRALMAAEAAERARRERERVRREEAAQRACLAAMAREEHFERERLRVIAAHAAIEAEAAAIAARLAATAAHKRELAREAEACESMAREEHFQHWIVAMRIRAEKQRAEAERKAMEWEEAHGRATWAALARLQREEEARVLGDRLLREWEERQRMAREERSQRRTQAHLRAAAAARSEACERQLMGCEQLRSERERVPELEGRRIALFLWPPDMAAAMALLTNAVQQRMLRANCAQVCGWLGVPTLFPLPIKSVTATAVAAECAASLRPPDPPPPTEAELRHARVKARFEEQQRAELHSRQRELHGTAGQQGQGQGQRHEEGIEHDDTHGTDAVEAVHDGGAAAVSQLGTLKLGSGADAGAARRAIRNRWKMGAAKTELGLGLDHGAPDEAFAERDSSDEEAVLDDGRHADAVTTRSGSSELDAATMHAARKLAARTGVLASLRAVASALIGTSGSDARRRAEAQERALGPRLVRTWTQLGRSCSTLYAATLRRPYAEQASRAYTAAFGIAGGGARADPALLFEAARAHEATGEWRKALVCLGTIVDEHPRYGAANAVIYRGAMVLKHVGEYTAAMRYLVYLTDKPCGDWAREELSFVLARVYQQAGNAKALARAGFEKAFDGARAEARFGEPPAHAAHIGFGFATAPTEAPSAQAVADEDEDDGDHGHAASLRAAAALAEEEEDAFHTGITGAHVGVAKLRARHQEPGDWAQWVRSRQPWERMAERAWGGHEYALAADMLGEAVARLRIEEAEKEEGRALLLAGLKERRADDASLKAAHLKKDAPSLDQLRPGGPKKVVVSPEQLAEEAALADEVAMLRASLAAQEEAIHALRMHRRALLARRMLACAHTQQVFGVRGAWAELAAITPYEELLQERLENLPRARWARYLVAAVPLPAEAEVRFAELAARRDEARKLAAERAERARIEKEFDPNWQYVDEDVQVRRRRRRRRRRLSSAAGSSRSRRRRLYTCTLPHNIALTRPTTFFVACCSLFLARSRDLSLCRRCAPRRCRTGGTLSPTRPPWTSPSGTRCRRARGCRSRTGRRSRRTARRLTTGTSR